MGPHQRSVAPLKPGVRHFPRRLFELDVQFYCGADRAGYARAYHIRDFYLFRDDDFWWRGVLVVLRAGDKEVDVGGDGYRVRECGRRAGGT